MWDSFRTVMAWRLVRTAWARLPGKIWRSCRIKSKENFLQREKRATNQTITTWMSTLKSRHCDQWHRRWRRWKTTNSISRAIITSLKSPRNNLKFLNTNLSLCSTNNKNTKAQLVSLLWRFNSLSTNSSKSMSSLLFCRNSVRHLCNSDQLQLGVTEWFRTRK